MGVRDIRIYIDETGDRGSQPTSSPIFGMAAVLVDDRGGLAVRDAVTKLRAEFGVPDGVPLSWKKHVKTHDRRKRAAEVLGGLPGLRVCYAYAVKAELDAGSYRSSHERFYNYVAKHLDNQVLWAARDWRGSGARVWTRFGHVKGFDHDSTARYLAESVRNDSRVPHHMEQGLRWVSSTEYLESQAADLFAGFLKAAVWPDGAYGYVEAAYLTSVWHQIHKSDSCVIPLGIHVMPDDRLLRMNSWFPCRDCRK